MKTILILWAQNLFGISMIEGFVPFSVTVACGDAFVLRKWNFELVFFCSEIRYLIRIVFSKIKLVIKSYIDFQIPWKFWRMHQVVDFRTDLIDGLFIKSGRSDVFHTIKWRMLTFNLIIHYFYFISFNLRLSLCEFLALELMLTPHTCQVVIHKLASTLNIFPIDLKINQNTKLLRWLPLIIIVENPWKIFFLILSNYMLS